MDDHIYRLFPFSSQSAWTSHCSRCFLPHRFLFTASTRRPRRLPQFSPLTVVFVVLVSAHSITNTPSLQVQTHRGQAFCHPQHRVRAQCRPEPPMLLTARAFSLYRLVCSRFPVLIIRTHPWCCFLRCFDASFDIQRSRTANTRAPKAGRE